MTITFFKDISKFSNTSDYLPILNGVLVVETIGLGLALVQLKHSKYLQQWYNKFGLSAVLAETTLVMTGIIIARFLYHYFFKTFSIWTFVLLAVAIQIVHDLSFYQFLIRIPYGTNYMLDVLKNYTSEMRYTALLRDSVIISSSCLLGSYLATMSFNMNIINLIITTYIIPYAIYS